MVLIILPFAELSQKSSRKSSPKLFLSIIRHPWIDVIRKSKQTK